MFCNFSYRHYSNTLKKIKNTHKFSFYNDCSTEDIILRHDVDCSLIAALRMASLEHKLKVQSTFFIYFSSEFYNPFGVESSKIIDKILSYGHKIGLHYNEEFIIQHNLDPSKIIIQEIDTLENHFHTKINAVAAHESKTFPPSLKLKLPKDVFDAYSAQFVTKRKYLSDSAMFWREGCFCNHYASFKKLHVLIHPMWWSSDNKNRKEIMNSFIGGEYDLHTSLVKSDLKKHEKWANTLSKKYSDRIRINRI